MQVVERVAQLALDGKFGKGTLVQVKSDSDEGKGAQYASSINFLNVELSTKDGAIKKVPIVVKTQLSGAAVELMNTQLQFTIEVLAYDKILPSLGANDIGILPKLYFGLATSGKDPSNDIIIVEDLRSEGFRVVKDTFLDYDVISLTLRKLGEFHGLSYKMKRSSMESLRKLINELPPRMIVDCEHLFKGGVMRGFRPFMESDPVAKKAFEKLSGKAMVELWDTVSKPEEPYAVVAHGDFNNNNILHSFDKDGKVKAVKFFDFATLSYLDPTTDISFFLYMNTSPESREKHWDDLLMTYWEGVTSVESNPGFGYEDFLNNFKKKAVYGLFPCSFFLPMVLFYEEANIEPDQFAEMSAEDQYKWGMTSAGEKGDLVISSIVKHLLGKGYLDDLEYL